MNKNKYPILNVGKMYKVLESFHSWEHPRDVRPTSLVKNDCVMYLSDRGRIVPLRKFLYKTKVIIMPRHVGMSILTYMKEID